MGTPTRMRAFMKAANAEGFSGRPVQGTLHERRITAKIPPYCGGVDGGHDN